MGFLNSLFKTNENEVGKLQKIVEKINALEPDFESLSDEQLREKTVEFKKRLGEGETLDEILPEAFATVREAAKRVLGERHFDVQLLGGIVLHQGKIAEVKTGEGKTLMATLPLYLNSLEGKGAHLVTVNDYLSKVGAGWMGAVYYALGVSSAYIGHESSLIYDPDASIEDETDARLKHFRSITRPEAYAADITYGTNNEFGFDYLRDNMAPRPEMLVQRDLHYAIVDEVDSILIDEARTPLIISAPAEESADLYGQFARLVPQLKETDDYTVDEKAHAVSLTDQGIKKVEGALGIKNLYSDPQSVTLAHHLEQALKAQVLFKKDKDYVVKDGEIVIVDEFTGRMMPGRRYSEGLHQAIEAKENVEIKRESDTLATISFQNLFRMYDKLAGMTGTAATEAEEFFKIYKLEVVEIPTNRPMVRKDYEDLIYKSEEGKFRAIVEDVKRRHAQGQPILIGTISIEKSERLAKLFSREGIKHQVLNAKQHEREAKIIAQAGLPGAITIATNMAGRGVDIILGGTPPRLSGDGEKKGDGKKSLEDWEKRHKEVIDLGGLHVIGSERHEARRIDNQLRGRAGRQGDPGSSQFFVSVDDDLMRIFGGDRLKKMMETLGLPEDQPIQHKFITRSIEQAQKKVEGHNFDIRKHLVEYDDVMNKHREVIYRKRQKILHYGQENEEAWLHQEILDLMDEEERKKYEEKCARWGETAKSIEKSVYLRTIDLLWIEHLNAMDELREAIGLRGYGQKDPLIEYKQEAYQIFQNLTGTIENEVVEMLLKVDIAPQQIIQPTIQPKAIEMHGADDSLAGGAIQKEQPESSESMPTANPANGEGVNFTIRKKGNVLESGQSISPNHKIGRNDLCYCGSGKKFKKCHGR